MDVESATKMALRELARRARYLGEQMDRLSAQLGPMVTATARPSSPATVWAPTPPALS